MTQPLIVVEIAHHICHIQLNRPEKLNAANRQLLSELAQAYTCAEADKDVRVVVVSAVGPHFTAGLDVADVLSTATDAGISVVPDGEIDPWGVLTDPISKPVIVAASGTCFTLGIELMLASDIAVADDTTIFGQIEVSRGILPFGGATTRLPARVGWGNAMRWLLTGDTFTATEALRMGMIQELTPAGEHVDRALDIARKIVAQAPLAVAATMRNARLVQRSAEATALAELPSELADLLKSKDFQAGVAAFSTRTAPVFTGE